MNIRLYLEDGTLLSAHGGAKEYRDHSNCLDVVPSVGHSIEYFEHVNSKNRRLFKLTVVKVLFKTTEANNGRYSDKFCDITCKLVSAEQI